MKNFYSFFNSSSEKATPNTRKHHQNAIRSINRKHQNQVAKCYGHEKRKMHPLIDSIVKNDKKGVWNISDLDANKILNLYKIHHIPGKSYSKSINRTDIDINYDSIKKKFTLSRS
jgi:hypothetical protein